MLEMNSYDTVCHEHLEYYALKQILWMARRTGFKVLDVEFNDVNGGSFSIVAAKSASSYPSNNASIASAVSEEERRGIGELPVYWDFSDRVFRHRDALAGRLWAMKKEGQRILGYGASTKGNVLLQFCGITPELIPAIAEVNASKFGCFTPSTLIPIISETEAHASSPDVFIILPWHAALRSSKGKLRFLTLEAASSPVRGDRTIRVLHHKAAETCSLP